MPHIIEIWETTGSQGTIHTPTCLACGWYGQSSTRQPVAVAEGEAHEAAESAHIVIARRSTGDLRRSPPQPGG